MSARGSHVDVNERRLRPIYDNLDYGNNKKAIQEADKVLKKQKNFPCAKALKGLALLRLGRQQEGISLLHEVHGQSPTDEPTLQALVICYRELHRFDLIADMYANAHAMKPDSEELLTALFMSYVRLGDYKKQQQTAMSLHRLKPTKNPYYFWAVMSIFMQAITDNKLGRTMFLPLAQRMTQKYEAEGKIEAEAEVKMYLLILERSCEYDKAIEVIRGPLGEKLSSDVNYAEMECARLLTKLQRWPEVNSAYRKLLLKEPDQWNFYVEYINSLTKMIEQNWTPDENSSCVVDPVDNTVEKALGFLHNQVQVALAAERPMRGPYLAQLELITQLTQVKAAGHNVGQVGKPLDMLTQYYQKFGDKFCCFSDMKKYVSALDSESRDQLLERLEAECPPALDPHHPSTTVSLGTKALQRHQTLVQLSRYLNRNKKLDQEQRNQLIQDLYQRYKKGLGFGTSLTQTEFQYSDIYISIIAHVLHSAWRETGECIHIWRAIVLLEKALVSSQSNFRIKLLLTQFYSAIGAFGPCTDLYGSLEIKHIQNDALGYVIANHIVRLGHFSSAGVLYDGMLRFFTNNHKDTTEHLISSYKFGSFTQVQEFVKFRERLQNSMQYASATAERLLLDMVHETSSHDKTEGILLFMDIDPEKDRTVWPDLRDNRDLSVLTAWEPPDGLTLEEYVKKSFQEETAWLKIRNLTVRCLSAAVKLGLQNVGQQEHDGLDNNVNNCDGCKHDMADILDQLAQQLALHLEYCRTVDIPEYPVTGPYRTRLSSYLSLGLGDLFVNALRCTLYMHTLLEHGPDRLDSVYEEMIKSGMRETLNRLIHAERGPLVDMVGDSPNFHPTRLEHLVHLTETIGFLTLLAGVSHRLLKPGRGNRKNKKKKDPSVCTQSAIAESYEVLVEGLKLCTDDLRNIVNETDPVLLAEQMGQLKLSDHDVTPYLEEDEELQKLVWQKAEKSYQESAKELEIYLDHKTKYLSTLTI